MSRRNPEITYEHIKRAFTPEDLVQYNNLTKELFELMKGKTNHQLWVMAQPGKPMNDILNQISAIRSRYEILKGRTFFRVWGPNFEKMQNDELAW